MLSQEEKEEEELLKLAKSEKLREDFRKLSNLNKQVDVDQYIKFLTAYSKIFGDRRLQKYTGMKFRRFKQAKKFLL
jgi:hypothetical protein